MTLTDLPAKNIWSYLLLIFPIFCSLPPVKLVLFRGPLKNCQDCNIDPGFRFFYGSNIRANYASLSNALFMDYDLITIGRGSSFSKDCIVITAEHDISDRNVIKTRPVTIGKNVWIATRSIILPGVSIGDNSVVGAGSVVTRSVPANCLVAGNPAKIIKHI